MPDYNNIEAKLEAAFQKVLQDALPTATSGITHFTGQTGGRFVVPMSWSAARTGQEVAPATGVFRVPVEVGCESAALEDPATDPVPAHSQLVAQVRDAVLRSNIILLLNTAAADLAIELTVLDVLEPGVGEDVEHTNFRNVLNLEVVAANASL